MPLRFGLASLLLLILDVGCARSSEQLQADLVVRNVTLIDVVAGVSRPGVDVVVRDGAFVAVVETGTVDVPKGAVVVDAAGAFAMPGLADMHVHLSLGLPAPRQPGETEEVLRRLLYYGVTSVLNLGASDGSTESIRTLWERQERGEVLGPTIYGTGGHLTLPGTHPVWTIFPPPVRERAEAIVAATPEELPADLYPLGLGISVVRTAEAARLAVRERAAGGMHAIKISVETGPSAFGDDHPLMPAALIREIVAEARTHELPVFAHVSSPHELDAVLAGGAAGIVHAVSERPFPSETVGAELVERQFHVVATLSLFDAFIRYAEEAGRIDDPFLRESVGAEEVELLARAGLLEPGPFADSMAVQRADTDATMRDVGELHRLGVPVVLGTDVGNPRVFAGHSAHEELANLVKAGLTPLEALRAGSVNAARMLGLEEEFGSVEVGKRADLLILDGDPLQDIRNSRKIRAVIARGRLIDRQALVEQ
jgi:imidazolonepropionase-like amidohydrolase